MTDNSNLNSSGIDVSNIAQSVIEKQLFNQNNQDNFDINWANDFENGFLDYLELVINPELKKGYFGLGAENRPKIVVLNSKDNANKVEGYRLVEFLPNHDVKSESYFFFGTPLELMTQICNFFNQWLLIKINSELSNNDTNTLINVSKNKPLEGVYLKIYLCTKKKPPFYQTKTEKNNGDYFSLRYVTIPVVDISKLTYENIRNICNNSSGQNWGLWSARAYLKSDIGIHQIVAGGNSEDKAIENLKKFLPLSKAIEFRSITTRHDYDNLSVPKKFDLYPAYIKVINYDKIIIDNNVQQGKNNLLVNNRVIKSKKFNIYADKPPSWFNDRLKEVLRIKPDDRTQK